MGLAVHARVESFLGGGTSAWPSPYAEWGLAGRGAARVCCPPPLHHAQVPFGTGRGVCVCVAGWGWHHAQVPFAVDEDISRLEVSVDDGTRMHMGKGQHQLRRHEADLRGLAVVVKRTCQGQVGVSRKHAARSTAIAHWARHRVRGGKYCLHFSLVGCQEARAACRAIYSRAGERR
eukprot:scaffold34387_cov169-Isochrysis_galbana.AAC.3